jgi:branched-chain amino acid transport system substrate-binding protein
MLKFVFLILFSSIANSAVKIAYVGGLTGNYSQSAQKSLKALKLATKEFNRNGGVNGQKAEIIEFDTKNQPANIFKIFQEILKNKVVAIAGLHISNETLILAKLAEEHHIPMVVASATHPDITKNKKYVVRVCFNDDMQGESLAKYSRYDLKAKNVAVVADVSDSFTDYLSKTYQKTFTKIGGKITHVYPIRTNDTEFGSIIELLRKEQHDLLFISASPLSSGRAGTHFP